MKNKYLLLHLICLLKFGCSFSQDSTYQKTERFNAGVGLGIDHGGIGFDLTYFLSPDFGLTGCIGFRGLGPGINAGIKYRFLPKKAESTTLPFLICIYGTNYKVAFNPGGYSVDHKLGPTFGFGIDWKSKRQKRIMWSLALLAPIRDEDYNQRFPFALSFGIKLRSLSDNF